MATRTGNPFVSVSDTLFGTSSADTVLGWGGDDFLFGRGGNDKIDGGNGNDQLFGESGNDDLIGGSGDDWLDGGTGGDYLTGGTGFDTFRFNKGDSGLTWSTADTIMDFDRAWDWVDANIKGTVTNYREASISFDAGFDAAKAFAATQINSTVKYVFVTDKVDGYLFADLDGNGKMDSGIELLGLSSRDDFQHNDII